ncbi:MULTISPECIES: hypothetical protein [unclassified Microcoleus]|uniref:hypothetical protein n=1 Tax=unclassified Microcoleus TaxID=2642155 RepID=UPI002FD56EB7
MCFSRFKIADRFSTIIVIKENQNWAIAQLRIELLLIATGFKLPLKSVSDVMQD